MATADYIKLLPDLYEKSQEGTVYKFVDILNEQASEIEDVLSDIEELNNIDNLYGPYIELESADYGLQRTTLQTDEELLGLYRSRLLRFYLGNSIFDLIDLFVSIDPAVRITQSSEIGNVLLFDGTDFLDGTRFLIGAEFNFSATLKIRLTSEGRFDRILADSVRAAGVRYDLEYGI